MSGRIGLVGVVAPVLDNAATIGAALDSVLAQEPSPNRVVVVDGGSTDGTLEVARTYSGVEIVQQRSRGLGGARNEGVARLDTDLVAFCDGDDYWTANSLAARLDCLAAQPDCGAVTGRYVEHDTGSGGGDTADTPRASKIAYTPTGLLARAATMAAVGGFSESLTIGTDSDWFIRLRASAIRFDVVADVVMSKGVGREGRLSSDVSTYRAEMLAVARTFIASRRAES